MTSFPVVCHTCFGCRPSHLVVFRFILNRVAGAADSVETPRRPSPQTPPPAPPGGAQGVPRPAKRHSPSSVSWAIPWASSRWDVPEEAHFSRLCPGSRSFSHDPKFMTIGFLCQTVLPNSP
ncbi:hypothetical protein CHARACLAT_003625 [Characodon lateralis]|uniref:Uncharacterized protein n=1 Tax=Characodon lateralis TaxID=208331 RepID=A0ABU7CUZ7_9TELE|nr:hypothetical protein [Characodon lateralis]